jgi:solute carrier family 25 carnitine/acylcarnitine transporter 20/29
MWGSKKNETTTATATKNDAATKMAATSSAVEVSPEESAMVAAQHAHIFPVIRVVEEIGDEEGSAQTVRFVDNSDNANRTYNAMAPASTGSLYRKLSNSVFGRTSSSGGEATSSSISHSSSSSSSSNQELHAHVPVVLQEEHTPAATAAAATTLLPESLAAMTPLVPMATVDAIVTDTTLSSSVSVATIPSIHNATNDLCDTSKTYHQLHDDHIPIVPSFVPHLSSHHHVNIPHRNYHVPHRHHVLKKHMQKHVRDSLAAAELDLEEDDEVAEVNTFHDLLAGGIAGSASVIVGHPFDTMKVRMQTTGNVGGDLMNAKAIKGLFRGMGPPLGAAGLVNALVFSTYGWSNRMWDDHYGTEDEQRAALVAKGISLEEQDKKFKFNWKAYFCGCFAGLAQTFVLCPTEHVKCRLQVQASSASDATVAANVYKGPVDAASQIFKSHGVAGLYRGFSITAWREVPAFGLYFTSYDYLKNAISDQLAKRDMDQPWIASGISGGVSGCLTWLVVYPTDVIKSRIQTQSLDCRKGIMTTGREIYREGGVRLLFRGLGITLLRAFPVNGVIFPVYEFAVLQLTGGDKMLD